MFDQDTGKDTNSMLEVEIENFGPIASGRIELKPLTILMGSNNSGKSYAALLIYSIIKNQHQSMHEVVEKVFSTIINKVRYNRRQHLVNVQSFNVNLDVNIAKNFEKELRRNFSSQLSGLVQINQNVCTLKISSPVLQYTTTISKKKTEHLTESSPMLHVKVDDSNKNVRNPMSINGNSITLNGGTITRARMTKIMRMLYQHYNKNTPLVNYLPASRYGVWQGHKILAEHIIKQAPYIGFEDFHVPKMPGAVIDFLGTLVNLPPEQGSCNDIAQKLEKHMLHGTIEVGNPELPVKVSYIFHDHSIPLHRTSSMVSEIAPLILYLRYLVEPKSLLIIEEPESHLHPNNQIYLAKCIVELIRKDVYVLITTHSPYLVDQISNYLQASGISEHSRDSMQEDKSRYIRLDEIAVYSFDAEHDVSRIKDVSRSIDDGINQRQFVDAFETISKHSRLIEEYYDDP